MKKTVYVLPIVLLLIGSVSYAAQKGESQIAQYTQKGIIQPVEKNVEQPAMSIVKPDVDADATHDTLILLMRGMKSEPGGRISVPAEAFHELLKIFDEIEVTTRPGPGGRNTSGRCCIHACRGDCLECVDC